MDLKKDSGIDKSNDFGLRKNHNEVTVVAAAAAAATWARR